MKNNNTDIECQDNAISLPGVFAQGYGFVPKLMMKDKGLSLTAKCVLCYLLSYTGSGNKSWPRHDEIIQNLGISKRSLTRSINQAIEAGYISRERRFSRGLGSRNIYHLLFLDTFRTANNAPSKKKKVPSCPLEGSPEHPPYKNKQENKQYNNRLTLSESQHSSECSDPLPTTAKNITEVGNSSLSNEIKIYFSSISGYYHDGKQAKAIKNLIQRFKDSGAIFDLIKRHKYIIENESSPFWTNDPHTPEVIYSKADRILAWKTQNKQSKEDIELDKLLAGL